MTAGYIVLNRGIGRYCTDRYTEGLVDCVFGKVGIVCVVAMEIEALVIKIHRLGSAYLFAMLSSFLRIQGRLIYTEMAEYAEFGG